MNLTDIFCESRRSAERIRTEVLCDLDGKGKLAGGAFPLLYAAGLLYLLDYIDILNCTLKLTADPGLQVFLRGIIRGTENKWEKNR